MPRDFSPHASPPIQRSHDINALCMLPVGGLELEPYAVVTKSDPQGSLITGSGANNHEFDLDLQHGPSSDVTSALSIASASVSPVSDAGAQLAPLDDFTSINVTGQ